MISYLVFSPSPLTGRWRLQFVPQARHSPVTHHLSLCLVGYILLVKKGKLRTEENASGEAQIQQNTRWGKWQGAPQMHSRQTDLLLFPSSLTFPGWRRESTFSLWRIPAILITLNGAIWKDKNKEKRGSRSATCVPLLSLEPSLHKLNLFLMYYLLGTGFPRDHCSSNLCSKPEKGVLLTLIAQVGNPGLDRVMNLTCSHKVTQLGSGCELLI
jgi:hypothetical protein